jgi:signal transduction histidine kinase
MEMSVATPFPELDHRETPAAPRWLSRGAALLAASLAFGLALLWVSLQLAVHVPWAWLTLPVAAGAVALAAGTAVPLLRSHAGAYWYFGTSVGLALACATAAVYDTRELALPEPLFRLLSVVNHLGGLWFTGCALAMLWVYPQPLGSLRTAALFPGVYLLAWALDTLQWPETQNLGFRLPIMAGLLMFCALGWLQWRRARGRPADRAVLKWFLFAWLAGAALFVATVLAPSAWGLAPLMPQGYLTGLLLLCYLCLPLALSRYRLFELDRWWFNAWTVCGALVLVLVLNALLDGLGADALPAPLMAAVALVGWGFFPLRRQLWRWQHRSRQETRMARFTQASAMLLKMNAESAPIRLWKQMLQTAFAPLEMHAAGFTVARAGLAEDGEALYLPAPPRTEVLILRGADLGGRLFDRDDVNTASTLAGLFTQALNASEAHALGAEDERARLRRELHEDLGARLLTQIHSTPHRDEAAASRVLLEEVRSLIDLLDHREFLLAECAGEWKVQFEEQCQQAGVAAVVSLHPEFPAIRLTAVERSYPQRILREALGNAARHSAPDQVRLHIGHVGGDVTVVFEHDGLQQPSAHWRPARGLRNIDLRVRDLRGTLAWSEPLADRLRMELRFPPANGVSP